MPLSANTLFHFTRDAESLISIMQNGFFPRFCLEDFTETGSIMGSKPELAQLAVPMVCFCDIPLSMILEHVDFYGHYGIGLTKDWGIANGLNPLVYLTKDSLLNRHLVAVRDIFRKPIDGNNHHLVHWVEVVSYIKPVRGKMFKGGAFVDKVFYDENEWRYVPVLHDGGERKHTVQYRLGKEQFMDPIVRTNANNELKAAIQLKFAWKDIKYLVVPGSAEGTSLANNMRQVLSGANEPETNTLISKIITCEQVREDF